MATEKEDRLTIPTERFVALYGLFIEAVALNVGLERCGWPASMEHVVSQFRAALERAEKAVG